MKLIFKCQLTVAPSLLFDALSAMLAVSGGVRCPSQFSTKNEIADAPISMAWPNNFSQIKVEFED